MARMQDSAAKRLLSVDLLDVCPLLHKCRDECKEMSKYFFPVKVLNHKMKKRTEQLSPSRHPCLA